jgi:hypothetical protein
LVVVVVAALVVVAVAKKVGLGKSPRRVGSPPLVIKHVAIRPAF